LQDRPDRIRVRTAYTVDLPLNQSFVYHHRAEDVSVSELPARFRHGPPLARPYLKQFPYEILIEWTFQVVQDFNAVQGNAQLGC
jgi:hypothetical protein